MPSYPTLNITDRFGDWRTKVNNVIGYLNTFESATNAEVIAGANTLKYISPAILASIRATLGDVTTGTDTTKYISPAILASIRATLGDVTTGTDTTKYISPAILAGLRASAVETVSGTDTSKYLSPAVLKNGIFISRGELSISTSYTLTSANKNLVIVNTGSNTVLSLIPAASAGVGFVIGIRNAGSGDFTIDPDGLETVNTVASIVFKPGETGLVYCTGSAWYTIGKLIPASNTDITNGTDNNKSVTPSGLAHFKSNIMDPSILAAESRSNDFAIAMYIALS